VVGVSGSEAGLDAVPRHIVGVSLNAAIDKIAAVDRLEPGSIHRPEVLSALPGGKAVNVARAANRLGMASSVVAVVGGHAGAWFEESLSKRGIPAQLVRVAGETRTCLSVLDRSTRELTEFYEPGVTLPPEAWPEVEAALARALAVASDRTLVVLAGSLPPGAPVDAYARLARVASVAGAEVAVDIGGEPLLLALAERPWLVKVNASEAAESTGLATDDLDGVVAAARRLRELGARGALVTRGADGAVFVGEEAWVLGPPPELGPYSVGSGDALLAGYAVALADGRSLPDALRYATAVAAANALTPGQGEVEPPEVDRLFPQCVVHRLDRSAG
jgi:1-phosphofructokinase family hexose kinase